MRLSVTRLAAALAIVAGGTCLLLGLGNLGFANYGVAALEVAASIYPGYDGPQGLGSVVIITLYATLDGAIAGAVIGWLYNALAPGDNPGTRRFSA
ncbi:MAG: hypothetical protein PVH40_03180 [Gemmatimonadales bacterium]|jgi:hypothetical protein